MSNLKLYQILQSASIILMLIATTVCSSNAQTYSTLLKRKLPVKEDALGYHLTKFITSDKALLLLSRTKSRKLKDKYFASYLTYDLATGKRYKIKFIADSAIFEFLDIDNIVNSISKEMYFIKVNEFERLNSNVYSSGLYIFNKIDKYTYQQIDVIKNFQHYEGRIHQIDEDRVLFYKNYDYHPLDDSIPSSISIYNFSNHQFETIRHEKFNGIYLTNLVGNFFALVNNRIFKAYPYENLVTISDSKLNPIDTIIVPIDSKYSDKYSSIDSLKKTTKFKKDFIKKAKEIDNQIERIESIFILNKKILCVVLKPKNSKNFDSRQLLYYDITNNKLVGKEIRDYTNTNNTDYSTPNLTYNNPFIMYNEALNSIIYITKNQYINRGKIKGDSHYYLQVLKFNYQNSGNTTTKKASQIETEIQNTKIFNLKGDTTDVKHLSQKNSVILVLNERICQPCITKAYLLLNTQYRKYSKYIILEYNENSIQLLSHEKRIKKSINTKEIYYYKPDELLIEMNTSASQNIHMTPSPFILYKDKTERLNYIPVDELFNK